MDAVRIVLHPKELANHEHSDIRNNDITDVLDETFSVTEDRFGEIIEVELKPGGANIAVTEENKKEYVEAVVEYRTKTRIREQTAALLEGFRELVPAELIDVFDERELELLIGGMSEIDTCVLFEPQRPDDQFHWPQR